MSTKTTFGSRSAFDGGQIERLVTPATARSSSAQRRLERIGRAGRADGRYRSACAVVYLKRFAREGRLGFGNV
jgi:hypothetical protein